MDRIAGDAMYSIPMILTLLLYSASTICVFLYLAGIAKWGIRAGRAILIAAAIMHLLAIGHHHVSHREPAILSAAGILSLIVFVFVVLLLWFFGKRVWIVVVTAPVAAVMLGTAVSNFGRVPPHAEALSVITPGHIVCSTLGFVCLGAAAAVSFMRIVVDMRLRERRVLARPNLPPLETLDRMTNRFLEIGLPIYTMGVILGVVWAFIGENRVSLEQLLGIATWAIFAGIVFARRMTGWRGRRAAVLVVAGFITVLPVVLMYGLRRWMGT